MNVALPARWSRRFAAALPAVLAVPFLAVLPTQAHEDEHGDAHVLIFTKTTAFRHTEAINQGTPVLQDALEDAGITSEHTEDSSIFNDEDLAHFDALVMFQTSGDPWTEEEKAALERYQQAGGGIVAIHNAADMRGNYTWWDDLIGSLMPAHAATGTSPGLSGTVRMEDQTHPSTTHLPQRWNRADEWYNFSTNVRGDAHVLATMDETTYNPGSAAMGYDHPISWCKPYDGGRAWVTAMGHFGAHYTEEPDFVQHIVGGVDWAAGRAEGDCGGTVWDSFEKVALDQNTSAPFGIDVAPDGRVFFSELVRGEIRVYNPATHTTTTAITIPVYSGGEDGLLSIALDPDFDENGHLFLYYSPASDDDTDPANFFNQISRFTVNPDSTIDPDSEVVIMEVPARRLPDEPGHTGGGMAFGPDGNLFLSVGDDVNPHSEPSGAYAPLSTVEGTFHDARATSANTNDLRGKLLRITPEPDGGYTIPEGNMFEPGTPDTRPEIYAMGFRNPFRFSIDPKTGWVGLADYGPDATTNNPNRGPAGIVEWNLIKEPGFYGWPLCMGPNLPFLDVDYTTSPPTVGDPFDCDNPVNDSPRNTGLTELPPAQEPVMYYGYQTSSVPDVIPAGGGLAPMGGPFYDFDPDLESDTKFPEYYDGKPFFYEWSKNRLYSMILDEDGDLEKINHFLPPPTEQWMAPIDSTFGPDGSLYVLDWGGGFGRHNPDSGLYRVDYVSGSRSPVAVASGTPDSGHAPLEVQFSSEGTFDPEGEPITYEWDFENDGEVDSTELNPTHTYTEEGVYDARLTVTDPHGKTGTTTVPITVGNTRPTVEFTWPPNGGFFEFGDEVSWDLEVSDPEDGEIADEDIIVEPALGHDDHAHATDPHFGRTGSVVTSLGGHGEGTNVFYVLDARYTDEGAGDIPPLTGSDNVILRPKRTQAEFHTSASEEITTADSRDVEGGGPAIVGQDGAWAAYDPVNLTNIDSITLRVAAASAGEIELRRGAPDGELLGTAEVPATGGLTSFADVTVEVDDPGVSFELYLVFPGSGERRVNFLEADGKGVSPTTRPQVAITSPDGSEQLETGEIEVTAEASDAENEVTEVEFFVDGESIGVDTAAPYTATWDVEEENLYHLTAVATNDQGLSRTSRIVVAQVGELFGAFSTFANTDAEFERLGANQWAITAGGANMWTSADEYGSLYLPAAAAGDRWWATVKVESQTNTHQSAKAGLIVRNDVTQPGQSRGYAAMTMRAGLAYEWLRDTGNPAGFVNASSNAGSHGYPAWVRIARDGDEYTAYWSSDGENFTQVGPPEVLPGAADVQDIGMVVTAHSSTATSRAVFSDFELDLDPPDTEPPAEPEPGPVCLMQRSDEFDGDALDTRRWTEVRNAPGAGVELADGSLVLPVTDGDINEDSTGPISYVGQAAPDEDWTVESQVTIEHTREWQHAGLMLHEDDDSYVKLAFTRNAQGERFFEFQTETAGSRTWHDSVTVPADFPATVQLRLARSGSEITAAYSTDGEDWTDLSGAARVKEDATIGMVAAGDTGAIEVDAVFDWFSVEPDVDDDGVREPSDEFDGDALDGCRWDAVVRYNSDTVRVEEGELRIDTEPGDINGTNNNDPRNFILQSVPDEEEWTVETRMRAPLLHQWQLAGFMVYGDDDNYVKLDVVAFNQPGSPTDLRAELVSEIDAQFGAGGNRNIDIADSLEGGWWYLRLAKSGDSYEGWVSEDGSEWTSLGDPVTGGADLHSVGLMALGPDQEEQVTVAFDYFRVVEDDTTPPVVTVETEPVEPDGAGGWYVSPVTVSASATDDGEGPVLIEVSLGDGEWAEYTGPVSLDEDGVHELRFRGTDEAGNTSEPVEVTVALDATAPELEVTGVEDGGTYELGTELEVSADASDAVSGVASVTLAVDDEPVDSPVTLTPGVGEHTVVAVATDEAGNVAEVEVTFQVDATFAAVLDILDTLRADGVLSTPQHSRLRAHLNATEVLAGLGLATQAGAALDRFVSVAEEVSDDDARAQLLAVAENLRGQL